MIIIIVIIVYNDLLYLNDPKLGNTWEQWEHALAFVWWANHF